MKRFYKAGILLVVFTLLLMNIPVNLKAANASGLFLTREEAKQFEGKIAADYENTSYIRADGTVYSTGGNNELPLNVRDWKDLNKIVTGNYYTVGLRSDGTVVATGSDSWGSTSVSDWTNIVDIAAGDDFTVGLKSDGSIVSTGYNASFRTNFSNTSGIVAIAAGNNHTIGLKMDGTVVAAGENSSGQSNVTDWKDIVSVAADSDHTVGLKNDGTVVATGGNWNGQLDVNGWTDIVSISTSNYYTVGLKSDGTVVVTGTLDKYAQKMVTEWKEIVAITAQNNQIVGLKSDGTIVSAGGSDLGQRNVSDWRDITAISAGGFQTIGLKKDGKVVAAGNNDNGQLNVNNWTGIKAVAAGFNHTVGLKTDGTVVATGMDYYGILNVGDWKEIVAIAAGDNYSAGLKSDGTVEATGYDYYGIVPEAKRWTDIVAIFGGQNKLYGLKSDGTVVEAGYRQGGPQETNISQWKDIAAVSTSDNHTVGLKKDGTLVFKGYSNYDMISDTQGWQDIKAISAYHDHQVALKQDGTVLVNGNFAYGAKIVSGWKDIIAISSGYNHVVGLKSDGTVVAARNYPDNETLNTGTISVDKKIVKPSDTINVSLKNNGAYHIQDNQIQFLNGDSVIFEGQMDVKGENERAFSYVVKPSDHGQISIKYPQVFDLFGNNAEKQNAFQVIPLQSVVSDKTQTKSGDWITLTATFYQSVKPDFTIALSGGADLPASQMKEVEGSNGTKYTFDYTVPSDYTEGQVDAALKNVTTADGMVYDSYTEKAVFSKENQALPIQSLTASKSLGKIDDKITITATFSESVKPGVQITLEGENFTLPAVTMTEVMGSNGTKYVYTYPVAVNFNGKISARITNAYDQNGSLFEEYQQADLFEADGAPPYVLGIEATPKTGKLGDKVVITATFSEPVKPLVKLSFYQGAVLAPTLMKEVPGTNGTKYSYEYTIDESASGQVYADIRDVEDLAGNKYPGINRDGRYFTFNLFNPDGVKPTLTSFVTDKKVYEAGDVASITATFSEPVKPGVKIKLTGALNEEYEMTQVDNKTFEFYYVIPNDVYGNVSMELNFEDLVENTNQSSQSNAFFISNPSNAKLSGISIKSGTQEFPLTPSFSPDVSEYHLTLYGSVTNINVGATTEDPNTSVTGVGNASLKTGVNDIVLTATSKDGTEKVYKVIATVITPLSTPINVKAVSDSYNSVKLSWNAVGQASGYEIYRSTSSSGPFTKMATTTSTTYANTSLNTGTTYYYKVLAYKTGIPAASSGFSTIVSAKPIPVPPASVIAATSSYNSIRTSWGAVSGASGYEIYRATSSTGTYSLVGTTTSTSFVNGGLATNYSYYYKIRAYKIVGSTKIYSNFSTIVAAKPIPATATGVKAASSSFNSLKISWAGVSGASGYEVYRATSSSGPYSFVGTTTSTSLTNTGLTTNRLYFYKIRAYRMVGNTKVYSNYSTVVSAKPIPSVPTNFKAARLSSTSVKLTWSPVSGANGYELYRSTTYSGTYSLLKSTTSTSYINSGLVRGRIYYYKVRAYRTIGNTKVYSGWTAIISGKAY